jgi:tetratricopeptide (TPR) repeat protein
MNADQLVALGNQSREENNPEQALSYYAQAFVSDRLNAHAWNNYGNVLRELGDPAGALPFLQRAAVLEPTNSTTQFNIAVAHLLLGDYQNGWPQYETRWNFEHLAGTLPQYTQPRWTGQDLKDKTIFVIGEQGHGDNIQFLRFVLTLKNLGATVILQLNDNVAALIGDTTAVSQIVGVDQTPEHFDYWAPIMSLPGALNINLTNLDQNVQYIVPSTALTKEWSKILGPKFKLRVGFCWSGRRDTWINRHKGMPFEKIVELISKNPDYEWINLQADATDDESQTLESLGVSQYPGTIRNFADTASLIQNLDVVISVDTAIAHLSGAVGRPTWVMLNQYAVDWRWLLDQDSSPWYPTARLFRQPKMGDWDSVTDKIHQYLSWFKV